MKSLAWSLAVAALVVGASTCNQLCPPLFASILLISCRSTKVTMSKKRPGVPSGINLIQQHDNDAWQRVESHYHVVRDAIPNLADYEANLQAMMNHMSPKKQRVNHPTCVRKSKASADDTPTKDGFNKQELLDIVQWKHSVGQKRNYNLKLINSNTDDQVVECTEKAVTCARQIVIYDASSGSSSHDDKNKVIQEALQHLTILKGVGPATASAFLSLVRPDVFCYMYDEVIDCFENKRDYKMAQYLRVNNHCHEIALKLDWTTARVAKAIWTACRYLAITGQDLTETSLTLEAGKKKVDIVKTSDVINDKKTKKKNDDANNNEKPRAKRKRRQT